MPTTFMISMFAKLCGWLDNRRDQHRSGVLLRRQQAFLRIQRQQRQCHGRSLRDGTSDSSR